MKKLRNIFFIVVSITSLMAECQSNLNETTKTILDNAQDLYKKLDSIPLESKAQNTTLSIEQIINLFLIQEKIRNSELVKNLEIRKNSHKQLEIAAKWFEEPRNLDGWFEYLAIHNQMLSAIQQDINQLKAIPQMHTFCKEIGQRISTVFINAIVSLNTDQTISTDAISSLIYAYQDYAKLFQN